MIYYHSINNKINKTIKKLIMKRAILSVLLLFAFLTGFAQNRNICRLGITYDISQSDHWGKNEVLLTIGNLANPAKQVLVKKECKKGNAITEEQLATAFSMYSLETTSEREFVCPFKTTVTADPVDLGKFKTFAFSAIDENNSKLETAINESIEKELTKKGMTVDTDRPDIIVQTFYFFDKNPNYKGANKILVEKEPIYRYNFNHSKMETFPFLNSMSAEAEAEYLLQFAFMGAYYARRFLGIENPRVGLLNIGTEPSKGMELQKAAHALLTQAHEAGRIRFVGNIEGREAISQGAADVLVTDGFTGNIFLKTVEGAASLFSHALKDMLLGSTKNKLAALLLKNSIGAFKKRFDANEVGGTALLGISQPVIKAHGSSNAYAFFNAIRQAQVVAQADIVGDIAANVAHMRLEPGEKEG